MPVCIYCLKESSRLTADHVFARSYYPASTTPDVERWTVPACAACNNEFSRLEESVLLRLAACVDPKHPAAAGIWEKAYRSIDANKARDENDRRARAKKQREFLRGTKLFQSKPETGVLPSFDKNWEQGSRMGILVPADDLNTLVRKWVRGVHYKTVGRIIPDASAIDVFHVDERVAQAALSDILERATTHHRGPGIEITQAIGSDATEVMTLYRFVIWDQFAVHASLREAA